MANFFDQFDAPPSGGGQYADAISRIESGGNYRAVGPETGRGRALGRYQIMTSNVGPWSREIIGREVTPQEFMASPQLQDAIFEGKFGQYVKKYGPEGASRAWFAGEGGMNNPNARDVLGTSVADYSRKFTGAMPADAMAFSGAPTPSRTDIRVRPVGSAVPDYNAEKPQPKNFFDQFDAPAAPTVAERSDVGAEPANADALRSGLEQRAREMTTGPRQDHFAGMVTDFLNQGSAAGQGTTPNIGAQSRNLISTETFESDSGELLYRDPTTGQVVPTDQNKHVALRDPADGKIKVFARTSETDEGRLSSMGRILATGLATGAPTARPAIPVPTPKQIQPRASEIISTSKPHYRAFKEEAGQIVVSPEHSQDFANRIRDALTNANLIPELAQPVYSALGILEKGQPMTLDNLQNVKRVIGRAFNSPDKNVRDAASVASAEIGKILREVSPSAAKSLKTADEIHSTARSVRDLQNKSDVAGLRAGRAGYGGNAVNTMRQVLSPIVQKAIEGKKTGFKQHEITAMREIVEGTPATNAARFVGQLSPTSGLGVLKSGMAGGTAAGVGFSGGTVAAIPALGYAANKVATIMTGKQIDRLKELVAKRSPAYAQAVEKAIKRYEQSQMDFVNNPSPSKFAAYLSASRSLSAGFNRDGISITSGDLLKNLQLGGAGRAEDEQ